MRTWKQMLEPLTRVPRGFNADGRALGVGLAAALEKQRRDPAADVETFLRRRAADDRRTTTLS
ncbi:hypothetical protein [Amycolatopsis anabasis]|uniref:hypothetical protein n=1 Tax=Amycolatopsis anabasis TaxID=1840409 RepID=UPI00131B23EC|nr:hypothetical protein [Amycolatopsis anabasis]